MNRLLTDFSRMIRAHVARVLLACTLTVLLSSAWAQDLEMQVLSAPQSGCSLSANEPVRIRLLNHGPTLPAGTSFLVMYTVSNGSAASNDLVTLSEALLTNNSVEFQFTNPANLSAPGSYSFLVSHNLVGDINTGNNTIHATVVVNSAPSTGGTISAATDGSSGALTLNNHTGSVLRWEESPDNQRWFVLGNQGDTLTYVGLNEPTWFRARVKNGSCPDVVSPAIQMTP